MRVRRTILTWFFCLVAASGGARSLYQTDIQSQLYNIDDPPYATIGVHNVGKMAMTISNYGVFGASGPGSINDPLTGLPAPSLSYPKGFRVDYLYEAALWVGAIVGRDTLVSTSTGAAWGVHELWPLPYPEGDIKHRSTKDRYAPEYDSAVSQQDFIAIYTDTLDEVELTGYDYYTGRLHRPLKIEVTQRSYAWGYDYAEDFVIIDLQIGNIELRELKDVYVGLYVDNDCGNAGNGYNPYDDVCGFKKTRGSPYIPGLVDTLNIVWAADNDGDPNPFSNAFAGLRSPTSAIATKVLRTPSDEIKFNFNWWISSYDTEADWGPRKNRPGGVRRFGNRRLGTPLGDNDKYYMMATDEFDYNQSETYYDHTAEGWLPPPANAFQISFGAEIRYLLSFGPFNMKAGDILPFTFAFVGGQDFHHGYNFYDLHLNTLWASWIYDNPGVDTDGDGYRGKYHIFCMNPKVSRIDTIIVGPADTIFDTTFACTVADTLYYEGDGVPDFKGASPPTAPEIKLYPRVDNFNHGEIIIRWNGRRSESTPDRFSQRIDFEGYRVYISRSGRANDFTMVTSHDIENYDRYEYDTDVELWVVKNPPYDMRNLRRMYGRDFDPMLYRDEDNLFAHFNRRTRVWEYFFFDLHDWNQSDYRDTTGIHKIYPDQPYPSSINLDTARMFYPNEVTEEGQMKYFEYEYVLRNLLPSVPYYVSVAAFDHGFPSTGLPPLETNPIDNMVKEYAENSSFLAEEKGLNVIVYPNPYKTNGNYRVYYEGWESPDLPAERTRALHFMNLPHKCIIRIFSIDGDLIRELVHDFEEGEPGSMHETWDMISRNEMAITSGIYYYSVESESGNQVGKFVVIY